MNEPLPTLEHAVDEAILRRRSKVFREALAVIRSNWTPSSEAARERANNQVVQVLLSDERGEVMKRMKDDQRAEALQLAARIERFGIGMVIAIWGAGWGWMSFPLWQLALSSLWAYAAAFLTACASTAMPLAFLQWLKTAPAPTAHRSDQ